MPKQGNGWWRDGAVIVIVLGVAFALYGRLVGVETRLSILEDKVGEIHNKLFPVKVADHR